MLFLTAARAAEARRATAASLTEEVLAAHLKTKRDEAAVAAEAAEELAVKAAAAKAAAGATAAAATAAAGTTEALATGEARAPEDRMVAKAIATLQAGGLEATPPAKPPAAGGVTALLTASPGKVAVLYADAQLIVSTGSPLAHLTHPESTWYEKNIMISYPATPTKCSFPPCHELCHI